MTTHHTATEAALQETIRQAAMRAGALYYHTHNSKRSPPGFPDVVIVTSPSIVWHPPRLLCFEVKTAKGKVSQAQRDWLNRLRAAGIQAFVVRPVETPDSIGLQTAVDIIAGGDNVK